MRALPTALCHRGSLCLFILAFCALAFTANPTLAQFNEVPPPPAYAIEGATIVHPDGSRREDVTVIVRGSLIEAIGPGLEIPADAEPLEGDSLLIYAGFIDADGEAAYEFPEVDAEDVDSWAPPREVQGFMPERRVVDYLEATGEDLDDSRKAGIVAAALLPDHAVMPGQGTLLLLRPGAERPSELVIRPTVGTVLTLDGARGGYPGTLFGVMAFIRQSFEDAGHHAATADAYASAPGGMTMPGWDPSYEVLQGVMAGGRVFFRAESADDIRRGLGLADEYGFRPVIVGGTEAWKVADLLRDRGVPVLVSLDFPEPERWELAEDEEQPPDDDQAAEQAPESQEAPDSTAAQETQEALEPAAAREKVRIEAAYANAGKLAEAGVTFALTSGGGAADLRDGARKAMEYGLAEADAHRALTATPGDLLGVAGLTRIEAGYPATFIVASGPLFDESTRLNYTFIEGVLEEGDDPSEAGEPAAVDVTGAWDIEVSAEGQTFNGTMTLEQTGNEFDGSLVLPVASGSITDGVVSGNSITFTFEVEGESGEFSGTVEGDSASGSASVGEFDITWEATRSPGVFEAMFGGER